jgi:osmotically-inducible protein OsmY
MIVRICRCAAVAVAASSLLLAGGCNKPPEPVVTQASGLPNSHEASDVDVTTRVKTALLQDATLKSFDIAVVTVKGDVRLTGQVDKQSQIDRALAIARGTEGVHSLHDEITVKK